MFGKFLTILIISSLQQSAHSLSVWKGPRTSQEESNFQARYAELAQALTLGADCTWEGELIRQHFRRTDVYLHPAGKPHAQVRDRMMNDIVDGEYKICSDLELFVCDKASLKCVCGDHLYESHKGVNRTKFILEGTDKCRLNTNSYCMAKDIHYNEEAGGYPTDSNCKTGTTCRTGDGVACSVDEMMRYMEDIYGDIEDGKPGPEIRMNDFLNGRICSCVADYLELIAID